MFERIPHEMRSYPQWVVWKLEPRDNAKDTKVPYSPRTGHKASVTDPLTWGTFEEAVAAAATGQYSGIGFVLTHSDPYGFIDLDDTHGDQVALDRQIKVFREFNSYSEVSPGGGLHIIVKGALKHGRRRSSIEIYSSERYMTMTGNVYHDVPIAERQELLTLLWEQMGGPAATYSYGEDQPQRESDEAVIQRALSAVNGDKFRTLHEGRWQDLYPSQSEADFAYIDIIAFYTQNREQIIRIFRNCPLGQRDKAKRNSYVDYAVRKAFDRQLPPVDIDGLRNAFQAMMADREAVAVYAGGGRIEEGGEAPGGTPPPPVDMPRGEASGSSDTPVMPNAPAPVNPPVGMFPPGLVGEVAQFIYDAAPRPVAEIALAGAIGYVAGITGRAYNVSGTGLNQYVLLLAATGAGKEAIANGISKLSNAIKTSVPSSVDFIGPGEIRSDAALLKWLSKHPCFVSIVGEFGLRLKQMSAPNANSHETGLKRVLLDLFNKSGHGNVLNPMAYSDKEKNTDPIQSPSFTLLGESTPERFFEALDEGMISEGLLPRFTIIQYEGPRVDLNEQHMHVQPGFALVERLATLAAHCLSTMNNRQVINVGADEETIALFREFNTFCDRQINASKAEINKQLWNRAHIKAMKLAALIAVGVYPFNPVCSGDVARWAIATVAKEVETILAKFESGEVGSSGSSESKQTREVVRVIREYLMSAHDKYAKYGGTWEMHRDGVIMADHIQRRLVAVSCFRLDRMGATNSIKRVLQSLLDADDLREVPRSQMREKYGKASRAFVIADASRFTA